jgi:PPOX class probable F420-dependent enzyme
VALTAAVRDFLNAPERYATLASVNQDGTPQQTVMWFALLDDDTIMMNTKRGRRKDRNLLRDPRASVCIEGGPQYVTITGRITMVDDPVRGQADIHALAVKYSGQEEADQMTANDFGKQERITLLLSIDHVDAHELD